MADNRTVSVPDSRERVALELMSFIASQSWPMRSSPVATRDEKREKELLELYKSCLHTVMRIPL